MTKLLSLAAGVALVTGMGLGAANANEPVALTVAQMDNVTAGGNFNFTQTKFVDLFAVSFVFGNSATAEADAVAFGSHTHSQTHTFTFADSFTSVSQSISISMAQ